ncbi:ribonuclease E inhibitor RraA/Dimethylmenaquinone methyltransferase [Tirmania nivea]|nr:ribonuclease E inhibitor RraA/Dimethylmenaquinone methyltransferase [Tirmania nivea]
MSQTLEARISGLKKYTACDVSDALLKLKVPGAGFIPDLALRNPSPSFTTPIIAPACTVLFLPNLPSPPSSQLPNPNLHFADQLSPSSIIVIRQPPNQPNAVVGGIVAARMAHIGSKGIVVDGRVRDLVQLAELSDMPVFSLSTSTVGAGALSTPHAINHPITLSCGITVNPGDFIFLSPVPDPAAVCIPQNLVAEVLEILPAMVEADAFALEDVKKGSFVTEAFKRRRGKL